MTPIIALRNVSKTFGTVLALRNLNFDVEPGEVHCLLGDNGAGKSTLIKILAGVHAISRGDYLIDGAATRIASPRDALDRGIATVYQDLAMVPLMSITRNFFLGRELKTGWGPLRRFDVDRADEIVVGELAGIGIDVRDPSQSVGTLSGGERQCLAIARAVYFGARVLILDEPTSALGVHQAAVVLKYVARARRRGLGVIFISHNIHHAFSVADRFTLLNRGTSKGTYRRGEISRDEVLHVMAGGEDLAAIESEVAAERAADDRPRP
ncbi:ATP-binding cassette domain-containing protein [Labrys wisconsinensis]|uniref:Simple sugar transport system ATP-binding protein n=1 Tax=Labrys wisconsinensis TaxID=425677 RepID=A0ABU0JKJ6_9HYPH|nr:ATP-binding cassette domain-containing protein [Labrys wisconsinensis]MDQ0474817.1 simple sugar transport system ATP-binding protein [Labrys wisconsinensis]